jgi:hypothetical protein
MASKSIIDLEKCIDKEVRVKFQGGREGARMRARRAAAAAPRARPQCAASSRASTSS